MTTQKRDWVRIIGITGATLLAAGAITTGGLFAANATGLITLPQPQHGMHMGQQGGDGMMGGDMGGGRGGDHGGRGGRGGDKGGRGGDQGGRGGDQGWGGDMMPNGGMGGMGMIGESGVTRFDGTQISPEEQTLVRAIDMLQHEQALATALAPTSPAAKAIAATRTSEITALTAWVKEWYPSATIPTAPSASGTLADLRQMIGKHSVQIDHVSTGATFSHSELQQWLKDAVLRRATESTTLFDAQSS